MDPCLTQCCFCISLRSGCIIISLLMLLHPTHFLVYYIYEDKLAFSFQAAFAITSLIAIFSGAVFLICWICKRANWSLRLFTVGCGLTLVLELLTWVLLSVTRGTGTFVYAIVSALVFTLLNIYFMVVAHSYQRHVQPTYAAARSYPT